MKKITETITKNCPTCNTEITRKALKCHINKEFFFCNPKCSAAHSKGKPFSGKRPVKRSKIEFVFETWLDFLYPYLQILYNDRNAIGIELDIYIPSLKLAFELNGISHYEPVYGIDSLNRIGEQDDRRFYLCHQNNIALCTIDISSVSYVKMHKIYPFLQIIIDIVNQQIPKEFHASLPSFDNEKRTRPSKEEQAEKKRQTQKKYYNRRKEEALNLLGNCCSSCGATDNLIIVKNNATLWVHSLYSSSKNLQEYLIDCCLRCSKCFANTKTPLPSKELLEEKLGQLSPYATSRFFNVSLPSLRKWCVGYKIPLPFISHS